MPEITQNQLDTFWDGLQETLKNAGADISLRSPEDLLRIRITTITNPVFEGFTADVTASFPFSTNPDLDPGTATEAELVGAMRVGKPDNAKLTEMFIAAREGRLFFNSLIESGLSQRQLITDKDGHTSVLPDMSHATPEIMMVCRNPVKPTKPEYRPVGFRTAIAAFFGSKTAKARKREIERSNAVKRRDYERDCREWEMVKNMTPEFREQVFNSIYAAHSCFQIPMDEESYAREERLSEIGTKAHKRGAYNGLKDMISLSVRQHTADIAELAKTADRITPELELHLKEIFYMKSLENHMDTLFDENELTEKEMVLCAEQTVSGSDAYRKRYSVVCGERLRRAFENVTTADIGALAADPDTAAERLYNKLVVSVMDAPAQKGRPQLEKTAVKQPTREAPAAAPALRL